VSKERRLDWHSRRVRAVVPLECAECGKVSEADAAGWSSVRTGEIDPDNTPELFFFCPDCAEREFGG
jgi:hypothetical protein